MSTGMPAGIWLAKFGTIVEDYFGHTAYQVGSSLTSKAWRDVDVRLILPDDEYATRFGSVHANTGDSRVAAITLAFAALGQQMTGLPIDFQIQPQSHANEHYGDGIRSALIEASPRPSGDTVQAAVAAAQAPESPTDSTPKAGRGGSGEAETATGGRAPDVAAFASEMVARISMTPSKPLLPWPELPQDLAFLAVVIDRLRAGAQIMAAELALQGVDQAAADDIRRRVALLGTATTPEAGCG